MWTQAIRFCNWLSKQEGLPHAYSPVSGFKMEDDKKVSATGWKCDFSSTGYRLPSDAEWGYAAKCGSMDDARFSFGDDTSIMPQYVHVSSNRRIAALPCGSLIPNQFGLFDLEGNVWEWVWDEYVESDDKPLPGPFGPDSGLAVDQSKLRIIRGGGVDNRQGDASAESRGDCTPEAKFWNLGFRVVRSVKARQ